MHHHKTRLRPGFVRVSQQKWGLLELTLVDPNATFMQQIK